MLYISRRYATASHLCCCGCGREVVTPLNPAKWRLTESKGAISLSPSIGNWSFPCQSHYLIERGAVRWAGAMSRKQIAAVQNHDRIDAAYMRKPDTGVREQNREQKGLWSLVLRAAIELRRWLGL